MNNVLFNAFAKNVAIVVISTMTFEDNFWAAVILISFFFLLFSYALFK